MEYPTQYATLSDKYSFVDCIPFGSTCSELLAKLQELSNDGCVFRGQRNALWPIVATGQRAYIDHVKYTVGHSLSYIDFVAKALSYAKREKEFVPMKVVGGKRYHYDHEILGWLQHYSYLTPLIDFTSDPMVALYMATVDIEDPKKDGCFSIYAMPGRYEVSNNENVRLERLIRDHAHILKACNLTRRQMFGFDNWKDFTFCLIHKDGSLKPWDKNLAKERIASQNGLFVNLNDARISLEAYCRRQSIILNGGEGVGCILPRIKCIDVPNGLAPLVSELCKRKGYTAEHLGLADQGIDDFLKYIKKCFLESL